MAYPSLHEHGNQNPFLMALELSSKSFIARGWWQGRESETQVDPTPEGLKLCVDRLCERLGVVDEAERVACYEAGREGFWPARCLQQLGLRCRVMDSASIHVPRRHRRAKTDRLDVRALLNLLFRSELTGEEDVFSEVQIPSWQVEDDRRLNRERERLSKERKGHLARIRSLLLTQGAAFEGALSQLDLAALRDWQGQPLGANLIAELERELERWQLVDAQWRRLNGLLKQAREEGTSRRARVARQLCELKGIGNVGSWTLSSELLGWRELSNRRQVAAATGLVPVPYGSGTMERDQGISKAGPGRVRALMVELAWGWLRHQPQSELSQWYWQRFGEGGKRMRRIGIIALARRLVIGLWRYVEFGELPAGARLTGDA